MWKELRAAGENDVSDGLVPTDVVQHWLDFARSSYPAAVVPFSFSRAVATKHGADVR